MARYAPEQPESVYAREGTAFHSLCELTLRHHLGRSDKKEYNRDLLDWMLGSEDEWKNDQFAYLDQWLAFVDDILQDDPDAELYLEQVVDTGVPGCWGTADLVVVHSDGRIRVVDIKYGAGLWVSAVENSQLRLYGVGALNTLIDDPLTVHEITITVWQPRMDNVSDETLTRKELLQWRDELIPVAELALGENAPFGPSQDACRFCPAAGFCSARTEYMLAQDFGDPDVMTGEEMADAFSRVDEIRQWITAVSDEALRRAYEDAGSVPGFKVVRSGGRRSITDPETAVDTLLELGYPEDKVYSRKPATLGALEKLVGSADELQEALGGLLVKGEGRLSLVHESDKRPEADALHSAKTDFAGIKNEGEA